MSVYAMLLLCLPTLTPCHTRYAYHYVHHRTCHSSKDSQVSQVDHHVDHQVYTAQSKSVSVLCPSRRNGSAWKYVNTKRSHLDSRRLHLKTRRHGNMWEKYRRYGNVRPRIKNSIYSRLPILNSFYRFPRIYRLR